MYHVHIFEVVLYSSNSIFCYVTLSLRFLRWNYTFFSLLVSSTLSLLQKLLILTAIGKKTKNKHWFWYLEKGWISTLIMYFFTFYIWYLRRCNTLYFKALSNIGKVTSISTKVILQHNHFDFTQVWLRVINIRNLLIPPSSRSLMSITS